MSFSWRCPFCNHYATITDENTSESKHIFRHDNLEDEYLFFSRVIVCPNKDCKKFALDAILSKGSKGMYRGIEFAPIDFLDLLNGWQLIPEAITKVFPDYVPKAILADYKEACLIRDKSPKASATLARRCLQGMIRDFWGVSKSRLIDEIEAIKDKVDSKTWEAIKAVKDIGNIGAHMEKDVNLIIDIDSDEAKLLIELIETLIEDWYITKHEREVRLAKIKQISEEKAKAKSSKPDSIEQNPEGE